MCVSRNYDNWERLVGAVLQQEKDQEVARADSRSTSTSSSLDFGELSLSLLREEQNAEIGGRNSRFDANIGLVAEDLLYRQATIMGPMDSSYTGVRDDPLVFEIAYMYKTDKNKYEPLQGSGLRRSFQRMGNFSSKELQKNENVDKLISDKVAQSCSMKKINQPHVVHM
ncbi:Uncharacterized protein Fot_03437 [Forsythia ovata]|uniref:Uncharacterized protein n=1 Tax=Forsythia ovata TaxID=205694 RepID=A0ABD1XCR0_9LAMI